MKTSPSAALAFVISMAAVGCADSTGPSEPGPTLDVDGTFEGHWSVIVLDTITTCGPFYCGRPALAHFECPTTMDVRVTGDSTFVATFTNDADCVIISGTDTTAYFSGLAASASFGAFAYQIELWAELRDYCQSALACWLSVDSYAVSGTDAVRYLDPVDIQNDPKSFEALFGCTIVDPWWFSLSFAENGIALSGDLGQEPPEASVWEGRIRLSDRPGFDHELPARCAARPVYLSAELLVWRPPGAS